MDNQMTALSSVSIEQETLSAVLIALLSSTPENRFNVVATAAATAIKESFSQLDSRGFAIKSDPCLMSPMKIGVNQEAGQSADEHGDKLKIKVGIELDTTVLAQVEAQLYRIIGLAEKTGESLKKADKSLFDAMIQKGDAQGVLDYIHTKMVPVEMAEAAITNAKALEERQAERAKVFSVVMLWTPLPEVASAILY